MNWRFIICVCIGHKLRFGNWRFSAKLKKRFRVIDCSRCSEIIHVHVERVKE